MTTHPRPILIGRIWPEVGTLVHIRVKIGDAWQYTTRVARKCTRHELYSLVRQTRREFRPPKLRHLAP